MSVMKCTITPHYISILPCCQVWFAHLDKKYWWFLLWACTLISSGEHAIIILHSSAQKSSNRILLEHPFSSAIFPPSSQPHRYHLGYTTSFKSQSHSTQSTELVHTTSLITALHIPHQSVLHATTPTNTHTRPVMKKHPKLVYPVSKTK